MSFIPPKNNNNLFFLNESEERVLRYQNGDLITDFIHVN